MISNCVSVHTEYTLAISDETDDIAESNPLERKMFASERRRFHWYCKLFLVTEKLCVFILSVAFTFNQNKEKWYTKVNNW